MKKYLLLYSKRILRILPFVVVVAGILFGSLGLAFGVIRELDDSEDMNVKFRIGVVGTADDKYLSLGLAAFQSMDSTKYSLEIVQLTEQEAKQEMLTRKIAAYVVFPEGFMEAALRGNIIPIQYVSTAAGVDMVALVKDEVTQMVEQILYESQRGTYGVGDALTDNGLDKLAGQHVNNLAIEYVELVLTRSQLYTAQQLDVGLILDINGYLICSLSVLFLLLLTMPYAPLMIRTDRSMERLLMSRNLGPVKQIVVEFSLYFVSLLALTVVASLLICSSRVLDMYAPDLAMFIKLLPVVLCVAAWSFLCYEISRNMISGILLLFVSAVVMAFVGGCTYPATFFPETFQKIGAILPAGAARNHIATFLVGGDTAGSTALLLGYSGVFLLLCFAIRMFTDRSDRR